MNPIAGFFVRYLLAAGLSAGAVLALVPRLRNATPPERLQRARTEFEAGNLAVAVRLLGPAPSRVPAPTIGGPARPLDLSGAHAVFAPTPVPAAPRSGASLEAEEDAPPQRLNPPLPAATPRTDSPASPGQWGVVTACTVTAYMDDGTVLTSLPAGALVDVVALRETRSGTLAVCTQADVPAYLVPAGALRLRPGRLAAARPDEQGLRSRAAEIACRLLSAAAAATPVLAAELPPPTNPHLTAYQAVKNEYIAFHRRVSDLRARFDKATGDERQQIHDLLRTARQDEGDLRRRYDAAKGEFDAWDAAQAAPTGPAPATESARLHVELRSIEEQLAGFGP